MPVFADLLAQGSAHAWLFIPSAILLGALHGLEPGHSKTLMAAFIVAIRGTVTQAILLGLAATVSHTIVVWGIALGGLYVFKGLDADAAEPYFQLASGAIIVAIALWMIWQIRREAGGHDHHHHDETRRIDTGHGVVELTIEEETGPPRWRLATLSGAPTRAASATVTTEREDGSCQTFAFEERGGALVSRDVIPEPHAFRARLVIDHGHHAHAYDLAFEEHDHHHGDGLDLGDAAEDDAHARAHADDIRRRFAGRTVTTGQIVLFGLTGGLIPCPAAITVLLLCLQIQAFALGTVLVLCFSIGLALTLVGVGVLAALSVRHVGSRFAWFGTLARRAPYVSALLILTVGVYVGLHGWYGLPA